MNSTRGLLVLALTAVLIAGIGIGIYSTRPAAPPPAPVTQAPATGNFSIPTPPKTIPPPSANVAAPALAAAPAPPAVTYLPKMAPQFTEGELFGYFCSTHLISSQRLTTLTPLPPTPGAPPPAPGVINANKKIQEQKEAYTEVLEADARARAVYPNGMLRAVDYLVTRCEITPDSDDKTPPKAQTLVPAGAVIGVRRLNDGRLVFAVNGKTPPDSIIQLLAHTVQLGDPLITDDLLLGPPGPVAVDDTWPVNADAMLKSSLVQLYPGVNAVTGTMRLEAVRHDENGPPRSVVSGRFSFLGMKPPFKPNMETQPSQVDFELEVTSPLTPGAGRHDAKFTAHIQHAGRTGDVAKTLHQESEVDIHDSLEQIVRYVFDPARLNLPQLAHAPDVPDPPPPGAKSASPTLPASAPAANPATPAIPNAAPLSNNSAAGSISITAGAPLSPPPAAPAPIMAAPALVAPTITAPTPAAVPAAPASFLGASALPASPANATTGNPPALDIEPPSDNASPFSGAKPLPPAAGR